MIFLQQFQTFDRSDVSTVHAVGTESEKQSGSGVGILRITCGKIQIFCGCLTQISQFL